ncbi:hypothetical protein EYV94_10630 [Puteibacter caeruleilacunae]|nr:hypothetical protein EYV94_10630 [Puteibacter caeruleilacunae]
MYTVPIDLLLYSLRKRKVNQVRLYLYLKYMASGNIKLTNEVIDDICSKLHWCKKTFEKHRQWLLRKKWISYNNKTKSLHIKGYKRIASKWYCNHNRGVKCWIEYLIDFRAFCCGAVIGWGSIYIKRKKRASRKTKGDLNKDAHHANGMNELPNKLLAPILGLHYTTVSKYRRLAEKHGYLNVKQNYKPSDWPKEFLAEVKEANPDKADRLKVRGGFIVEQLPSTIITELTIKRKRLFKPKKEIRRWLTCKEVAAAKAAGKTVGSEASSCTTAMAKAAGKTAIDVAAEVVCKSMVSDESKSSMAKTPKAAKVSNSTIKITKHNEPGGQSLVIQ